jgi:hypothetical protein
MSCEHYWRDGVLLAERGEPDPHRDTCIECRRAHATRNQLVAALPEVSAETTGDPDWQMRVWCRIAREEAGRARRSSWVAGGLLAAAAVFAVAWFGLGHRGDDAALAARPRIEIVPGELAMRSASARVGDRARISVNRGQEVRVYRAQHLVLRCPAKPAGAGCLADDRGLVAEAELATAGEYQLVVISTATAEPVGSLDRDLAAVVSARGDYKITELSVR